jgi:hypothetical protein
MSFAELDSVTMTASDAAQFSRPKEAKPTNEQVLGVLRTIANSVPADHRPDVTNRLVLWRLGITAAVQAAINGTSHNSDFGSLKFTLWSHTYNLGQFEDAVSALPHPVERDLAGNPTPMTLRVFFRPFAKVVFSALKAAKNDSSYWPQLAVKYHNLCKGFEYVAVDFYPLNPDWMSDEELIRHHRVRKAALGLD